MPAWGTGDLAAARLADAPVRWQRSLHWREPERSGRRLLPGLIVGVLFTVVPIVMFDAAMRTELKRLHTFAPDVPIVVELLSEPLPAPASPAMPEAPTPSERRRLRPVAAPSPPAVTGMQAPVEPQPAAPLQLFGRDGAVRLPESEAGATRSFGVPDGNPLARDTPLPYEPTRFDRMMPSIHETLGGEIVRRTTYTRTFHTRYGTRITCTTSLVMAGLGICGWGVEPRATADELRAMRADPPMPKNPDADGAPEPTGP